MIPDDLKYTKEHEWIMVNGDHGTVGITDYAQGELGDIVFVELPRVGTRVEQMESFGTMEAVKAVSNIYAPVSGEVLESNPALKNKPELINSDPYGEGWIIKLKIEDPSELENLLSPGDYEELLKEEED